MNGKHLLAALAVAALALLIVSLLSHRHSDQPDQQPGHGSATRTRPSATTPPPGTVTLTSPPMPGTEVARLLPLRQEQIAAGVQVALQFTTAYGTWRHNQPPQQYLARLTPLMSQQVRPQLERAATDPTITTQRQRLQQTSTGQARAEAIRTLGPTSITVIVTGTQHLATPHTSWQETARYAITLTHHSQDRRQDNGRGQGWRVYGFELAATGDTGDPPQDRPADRHGEGSGGGDP